VSLGLLQVAICTLLAFATSVYAIVGLVTALSAAVSFTAPALSALTPAMVGRDNLAKASGIMQTAVMAGNLLAPALGGVLVGRFGPHIPLLIDAGTCLAVPAAGLLLRTRRRGGVSNNEAPEPVSAETVTWSIWRDPLVRPLVMLFGAVIGAVVAVNVVDVFFVRGTLHASATMYGLLSALWMAGMLGGTVLFSRLKPADGRSARHLLIVLAGTSGVVAVVGLVPSISWVLPLWIIGGLTNGGENVLTGVLLGRRAPDTARGRAFATFGAVANGATAIGLIAGGLLLTVASPRPIIIGTGLAGLLVIVPFVLPVLRAARRDETPANADSIPPSETASAQVTDPVAMA